jgi:hypothetical protein
MTYMEDALGRLQDIGVFNVLLPFLLVFTIVYAILHKTKILGDRKNFHIGIAFVIGMLFVIEGSLVRIMNRAIPNVGIILVAVLMVLILIGLFGAELQIGGNSLSGWIALISFVIVIYIFGAAAGWWQTYTLPWPFRWLADPGTQATLVAVLVFGIIVWFITREEKKDRPERDGFFKQLGNMLEKK